MSSGDGNILILLHILTKSSWNGVQEITHATKMNNNSNNNINNGEYFLQNPGVRPASAMGRCSLLCCYGWDQIPVSYNTSLVLEVPLPLQQQHRNGNIVINTNVNTTSNTNTDSDNKGTR